MPLRGVTGVLPLGYGWDTALGYNRVAVGLKAGLRMGCLRLIYKAIFRFLVMFRLVLGFTVKFPLA